MHQHSWDEREELGGRYLTRPSRHDDLGRDTGERHSRMASTCGPMHPSGCRM